MRCLFIIDDMDVCSLTKMVAFVLQSASKEYIHGKHSNNVLIRSGDELVPFAPWLRSLARNRTGGVCSLENRVRRAADSIQQPNMSFVPLRGEEMTAPLLLHRCVDSC